MKFLRRLLKMENTDRVYEGSGIMKPLDELQVLANETTRLARELTRVAVKLRIDEGCWDE